jgi:uncharacterized protein (TIGR01244 family)
LRASLVASFAALALLPACSARGAEENHASRPDDWAVVVPAAESLPNLYRVDPGLFRGAQPEKEGFDELEALGVRTLINLRPGRSEERASEEAGLAYEEIPMRAWRVRDDQVVRFLRLATDPARRPLFVHCRRGADRTGVLVAVYRIVVQGWEREEALREMVEGGYGFNRLWSNLERYVLRFDTDAIREAAGLDSP